MDEQQAREAYSRAYDCKHSEKVTDVMIKKIMPETFIDIVKVKMAKLAESCPHYIDYRFGGVMPLDYCQNHCKSYKRRDSEETVDGEEVARR